jgi:hypothetical protein
MSRLDPQTTKPNLQQRIEERRPMDLQDTRQVVIQHLFFGTNPTQNEMMNVAFHLGVLND